jgi:small subunit ribosomal protein S20
MANHTATKKSIRKTDKRTAVNKNIKTRVRTFLKNVDKAIASGEQQPANDALKVAQSEIMKAVSKNVFKLNTASRRISRLSAKIKSLKSA